MNIQEKINKIISQLEQKECPLCDGIILDIIEDLKDMKKDINQLQDSQEDCDNCSYKQFGDI